MNRNLRFKWSWLRFWWAVVFCHSTFLGIAAVHSWLALRVGSLSAPLTEQGARMLGAISAVFGALSLVGFINRWGLPALGTIGGFFFGLFWAPSPYSYTHDAHEVMMEEFGIPVIYALVGAIGGFFIEFLMRPPEKPHKVKVE